MEAAEHLGHHARCVVELGQQRVVKAGHRVDALFDGGHRTHEDGPRTAQGLFDDGPPLFD